jgi:hypothetical protein
MHKLNKFLTGYGMVALGLATLALLFASMVVSCNEEPLHEFNQPLGHGDWTTWRDPVAHGGAIKSWSTGEILKATDLNANFNDIHNAMVGGHGARLVDADVSSGAAISHSKLATPALVAKAKGLVGVPGGAVCDGAAAAGTACTVNESNGLTGVSSNAVAGEYRVNLSFNPSDTSIVVIITAHITDAECQTTGAFTSGTGDANGTNFVIKCSNTSTLADANAPFSLVVFDT